MEKTLAGQVALVTGSGRGLGRAIAERLADLGADVAIHDISVEAPATFDEAENLHAVARAIGSRGVKTVAVTGNIADEAEINKMVQDIIAALGPITILVNCAGGDIGADGRGKPQPNNALGIPVADMQAIVNRNLIGTMLVCRAVCPAMRERGAGAVVNIGSVAGHQGYPTEVVYATCKAAVAHYTRCLCAELRPSGVRVNCVSPGPTTTARFLATRQTNPAMVGESASLERYGTPAEVADVVGFLVSHEARFVNGQVIRVDGGRGLFAA